MPHGGIMTWPYAYDLGTKDTFRGGVPHGGISCERSPLIFNHAMQAKTQSKNRCLDCGIDLGPSNPRQLCGKSTCNSLRDSYLMSLLKGKKCKRCKEELRPWDVFEGKGSCYDCSLASLIEECSNNRCEECNKFIPGDYKRFCGTGFCKTYA